MEDKEKLKRAYEALESVLRRTRDQPELAWYFEQTETKAKVIDAFAVITNKAFEAVEEYYKPKQVRDPRTLTTDVIPEGYRLVPIEDEFPAPDTHIDWPARDHETFFWPVHLMNEALQAYGLRIEYQPAARAGHYEVVIGGVR